MAAAMGKIGAILAQVISIPILSRDAPPNCSISAGSAGSTGSGRGGISGKGARRRH